MSEYIYKVGLLSNSFAHLLRAMRDKASLVYICAQRSWSETRLSENFGIPYLLYNESVSKRFFLRKRSVSVITLDEWKRLLSAIEEVGCIDLAVNKAVFSTNYGYVMFSSSTRAKSEPPVRRDVMEIMKEKIDNLGFKVATLELSGIYKTWYKGRFRKDMLPDWESNKKKLIEIRDSIFKRFIKIRGKQLAITYCKAYKVARAKHLVLAGYERG